MRKITLFYFKGKIYKMDEQSTPIESLNRTDDTEVVNNILNKYNNLQDNTNLPQMEQQFENRNLNQEMYQHSSNNVAFKEHYENEVKRVSKQNKPVVQNDDDDDQESVYDDDEEYEVIEIPLWRRILNEIRIPIYIFIFIVIFNNCAFDKFLIKKVPLLGNQFNECNTYGFLLKAFLISIFSYLLIRFVRI
jgi:hypothetical protein